MGNESHRRLLRNMKRNSGRMERFRTWFKARMRVCRNLCIKVWAAEGGISQEFIPGAINEEEQGWYLR